MYNIPKMKKTLKKYMDEGRFEHTQGVMYTASALAMRYDEDIEKALTAGLLHDCAKCMPDRKKVKICLKNGILMSEMEQEHPFLLHGKVGAYIAREKYQVQDEEILSAITWHTTGKPDMTLLEKIVYISEDIELALFKILSDSLAYLRTSKKSMDTMTLQAYEFYKSALD